MKKALAEIEDIGDNLVPLLCAGDPSGGFNYLKYGITLPIAEIVSFTAGICLKAV